MTEPAAPKRRRRKPPQIASAADSLAAALDAAGYALDRATPGDVVIAGPAEVQRVGGNVFSVRMRCVRIR